MCCQQPLGSRRGTRRPCGIRPTTQWEDGVFYISRELGQSLVNCKLCKNLLWLVWGQRPRSTH